MSKFRKEVSMLGLLATLMKQFKRISEKNDLNIKISLVDCLMFGLSLFSLKYPSLLKFDNDRADDIVQHNLRSLFGTRQVPCDTYIRQRLDSIAPKQLRKTFTTLREEIDKCR